MTDDITRPWRKAEMVTIDGVAVAYRHDPSTGKVTLHLPGGMHIDADEARHAGHRVVMPLRLRKGNG